MLSMPKVRLTIEQAKFLFDHMKLDEKRRKKYPKEPHKWYKRKKFAVLEFRKEFRRSLTRKTLDSLIKEYPHGIPKQPKKLEDRYEEYLQKCGCWERLKDWVYWRERKFDILKAFRLLGNKCPETWSRDDVRKLRYDPTITVRGVSRDNTLVTPETKQIAPERATSLRTMLHRIGNYEPIKELKDVPKRPIKRKSWYFENEHIVKVIEGCPILDMLGFVILELQCGGRPTPTLNLKVEDLKFIKVRDLEGNEFEILNIPMFEPKKKVPVDRYFSEDTAKFFKRYIQDKGLKRSDRLFPQIRNVKHATKILKGIARKFDIELPKREGAGVYVLRHTYATQASEHDVSAEVIMDMGGWKTWDVVKAHYLYVKKEKKLREQLGIKMKSLNFGDWIKQFVPIWEKRYFELLKITV